MIKTNKGIYPDRSGEIVPLYIEILSIENQFKEDKFKFVIGDYILVNDDKRYINERYIYLTYQERDNLKSYIVDLMEIEGSESEIDKLILPNALLHYVVNDIINQDTDTLIYGTTPQDWELS